VTKTWPRRLPRKLVQMARCAMFDNSPAQQSSLLFSMISSDATIYSAKTLKNVTRIYFIHLFIMNIVQSTLTRHT